MTDDYRTNVARENLAKLDLDTLEAFADALERIEEATLKHSLGLRDPCLSAVAADDYQAAADLVYGLRQAIKAGREQQNRGASK